jgi:hypothetical protein
MKERSLRKMKVVLQLLLLTQTPSPDSTDMAPRLTLTVSLPPTSINTAKYWRRNQDCPSHLQQSSARGTSAVGAKNVLLGPRRFEPVTPTQLPQQSPPASECILRRQLLCGEMAEFM